MSRPEFHLDLPAPPARPCVFIPAPDAVRLRDVLSRRGGQPAPGAALLSEELERAQLLSPEEMPARIVRLGSRVRFEDLSSGETGEIRLVMPGREAPDQGRVSVLSVLGAALLGLPEDQAFEWRTAEGEPGGVRVLKVMDDFIWR